MDQLIAFCETRGLEIVGTDYDFDKNSEQWVFEIFIKNVGKFLGYGTTVIEAERQAVEQALKHNAQLEGA